MGDSGKAKRFFSFGKKLFISYVTLVITPIVIFGYYSYTSSVNSFEEKNSTTIRGTLAQIRDNIEYKMGVIQNMSDGIYLDQTIQNYFSRYEEGYYSYENMNFYLTPKFKNIINSSMSDIWILVYVNNTSIPEVHLNRDNNKDPLFAGRDFEFMHMERLEAQEWYRELDFPEEIYGRTLVWQQVDTDARFDNISLLRRLMNSNNNQQIGFMRMIARMDDLFDSVNYDKVTDGSTLVVANQAGEPVFISSPEPSAASGDLALSDDRYMIIEERIPGLDWTLTAYTPKSFFAEYADEVRNLFIVVCLVNLAVLSLLGAIFSRYFIRRVSKIIAAVNAFRVGDFHKRIHFQGRDEFAQIGDAINDMGKNIEELIQNLYVTNLQKKEAELEFLQAQINPHFLYNTLSSISRLAKFGELEKLHQTVLGLAKFYRLSLNDGQMFTTVDKELQHAQVYVQLQKTKYEDRLQVIYDIDPAVLHYKTIKLIIQPFIENALKHAWYGDRIHIRMTVGEENGNIAIKVIDDGVGISREVLAQLFDYEGVQIGYGIRNVDMRIKLQFGDEYGVTLFSKPGIGTTVKIVIPMCPEAPAAN